MYIPILKVGMALSYSTYFLYSTVLLLLQPKGYLESCN